MDLWLKLHLNKVLEESEGFDPVDICGGRGGFHRDVTIRQRHSCRRAPKIFKK